jgi:hypothetical protein
MAFFAFYNPPVDSTAGATADPSTSALLAELDSTNFGNQTSLRGDRLYALNIWVGGSTAALWVVEQATSTNIASTAVVTALRVRTASNQHSQFVKVFKLGPSDRIRVRHPSSLSGTFEASLQAQEIA